MKILSDVYELYMNNTSLEMCITLSMTVFLGLWNALYESNYMHIAGMLKILSDQEALSKILDE